MTAKSSNPRDPDPKFDYAAASEEIKALPPGSHDDDYEPPIPLELVLKPAKAIPNSLLGLFALVLFLGLALWVVRGVLGKRRWEAMAPERTAMQGLLSLGAAQRAYSSKNSIQRYGSPQELRRLGEVPMGFTPTNAIPGYSISFWSLRTPIWTNSGTSPVSVTPGSPYRSRALLAAGSFTLVAIPFRPSPTLRTFALCDDGWLRTPPGPVSNFEDACAWPQVPEKDYPQVGADG